MADESFTFVSKKGQAESISALTFHGWKWNYVINKQQTVYIVR